jgi:enoyl-CoA hydratase/carnithine racemase
MSERVKCTIDAGVADVCMARPEKLNALDLAMCEGLLEVGERLKADNRVRAVILRGEGRAFCAGLDFPSMMSMPADKRDWFFEQPANSPANMVQRTGWIWKELPVPVIAVLQGATFGGGLQIALGADIRLAAPDAQLSVMEIKWGLIPDMSGTQTLRDLVRIDVAKELTWTGRIVGAVEAAQLGLVTRVADDALPAARALAAEIAGKSPDAIRRGKQLLEAAWRGDVATGLALEAKLQRELLGSENQMEAVAANFQKRAPEFKDAP